MQRVTAALFLLLLAGCADGGGYSSGPSDGGDHGAALLGFAAQMLQPRQMPAYPPRNTTCNPLGGGSFSCQSY